MKYWAPFGQPDPDASFVNGDPGSGIEGSIPDCRGFEQPQREIVAVIEAAGLTPTGLDLTQLLQAIRLLNGGRLINIQVFATPGSYTYTKSAGVRAVQAEVQGGGGGSGGVPATSSGQNGMSVPGGSGSYGKSSLITSGFDGVTVTVGAGGAAGAAGATHGSSGGSSSFGTLLSSPGGSASSTNGKVISGYPDNTSFSFGAADPTGSAIVRAGGSRSSQPILVADGYGTGFEGAQSVFGRSYGAGADGVFTYGSTAATVGKTGNGGIVIVWEFS